MSTQVRDPFLAVTINGTGATHYRVAHENLSTATYTRLPDPQEDGTFLVAHTLPNTPGNYTVSAQLKNSLHASTVASEQVILLSDIVETVSTLRNKLRIAQIYGNTVVPDLMPDAIKCFYCWMSLYNNGTTPIDLSTVKLWTRYENCTSVLDGATGTYINTPTGVLSDWTAITLSGTIQPGKYFLIQGKRPATILNEGTITPAIDFTTFAPDLDLTSSLFISSKFQNVFLSDATLTSVPSDIFASGALTTGFIDLWGATSQDAKSTPPEMYQNPQAIVSYMVNSSKSQVRTIINPTIEALANSTDYSSTSIKSATPTTILTSIARPRNSAYVSA